MKCADLIGYSYRDNFTLETLYPFIKKLKKAKYYIREKKAQSFENTGQDGQDGDNRHGAYGDAANSEMTMSGTSASTRGTGTGRAGRAKEASKNQK